MTKLSGLIVDNTLRSFTAFKTDLFKELNVSVQGCLKRRVLIDSFLLCKKMLNKGEIYIIIQAVHF